jgi:hypothetical protein
MSNEHENEHSIFTGLHMLEELLPDNLYRRLAETQCDPAYDAHGNETVVFRLSRFEK